MKRILAIDPGKKGGWAFHIPGKPVYAHNMPQTDADILSALVEFQVQASMEHDECEVWLELVGGYVKGEGGQPGSAMFNFGDGFGFLRGTISALRIPLILVRPQRWQKDYSLGTSKSAGGKKEWKKKLAAEAQRRYPHLRVTHSTADALLILGAAIRNNGACSDSPASV